MKKNYELERCCKCHDSKAILKEIYYYGKVDYICLDCNNLRVSERSVRQAEIYLIPSFLKH